MACRYDEDFDNFDEDSDNPHEDSDNPYEDSDNSYEDFSGKIILFIRRNYSQVDKHTIVTKYQSSVEAPSLIIITLKAPSLIIITLCYICLVLHTSLSSHRQPKRRI